MLKKKNTQRLISNLQFLNFKNIKRFLFCIIFITLSNLTYAQVGAVGTNVNNFNDTALGQQTIADGFANTALGYKTTSTGEYNIVSGFESKVSGLHSAAMFGRGNVSIGEGAIAIGSFLRTKGDYNITIGSGLQGHIIDNTTNYSLMIGFKSNLPTLYVGPSNGVGTTGKVGIGTLQTPNTLGAINLSDYSLYVKGGILSEEVRVRTGWADYVFNSDYKLKSLEEVETFIEKNKHLPNVPSASRVEEDGLNLGDISRIQQEKIEELTLYIIQQNKRLKLLEEKIETLLED